MNTSKQVNAMIGLLFLAFLVFGAYYAYEPHREAQATQTQEDVFAERGATLFVANCRTCHGLDGNGPLEGGVGPQLNTPAFVILQPGNKFGLPATSVGDVKTITDFLTNTIACGRTNTFMPTWAQAHGGTLSDIQIKYIVSMITQGRWDLVKSIGAKVDAATGATAATIIAKDPSKLSVNKNNCGQYSADFVSQLRKRDPFAPPGASTATETPTPAATAAAPSGPVAGKMQVEEKEFSITLDQTSIAAGNIEFDVKNTGSIAHDIRIIKTDLAPDKLPVAGGQVDETQVDVVGKIDTVAPGSTQTVNAQLTPGKYVIICNVPGHYQLGMRVGFTVTAPAAGAAAATPAASSAQSAVGIDEKEFSITVADATVAAGNVEFDVKNSGAIAHNIRLIKTDLAPDKLPVAGGQVDESQVDVVAKIDQVDPGSSQKLQANLAPGHYVVICNVPGHYQLGMHAEFTVQ
jgi:uncharacterized cupredoxin-like copper-binding protein/mono/diheme cytochrome c family protein